MLCVKIFGIFGCMFGIRNVFMGWMGWGLGWFRVIILLGGGLMIILVILLCFILEDSLDFFFRLSIWFMCYYCVEMYCIVYIDYCILGKCCENIECVIYELIFGGSF